MDGWMDGLKKEQGKLQSLKVQRKTKGDKKGKEEVQPQCGVNWDDTCG